MATRSAARRSHPDAAFERTIVHYRRGEAEPRREVRGVIGERPLVIEIAGGDSFTIMRTPGDDDALTLGFLLAEGLIDGLDDVVECHEEDEGNTVRVTLAQLGDGVQRNLVINASCGLCGRAGIQALIDSLVSVSDGIEISIERLYRVPATVRARQALFEQTGGAHAAALFDATGALVIIGEDLGRHSALDKAIGQALRNGIGTNPCGIFLSGRTSLEMIVKAARARVGLVMAVSAPSEAAVDAAEQLGITLCGFARGDELAVYAHERRIVGG